MWEFFLSCNCQQILFCFWKIGSKFPETWILTSIFHKAKMSHRRLSVKNKETKWNLFFREIDCISRMVPTTWVADYTHSHFVGPLQVSTHFILGQNFFSVIGQTYTCKCTYHMQKKKKMKKKGNKERKKIQKKKWNGLKPGTWSQVMKKPVQLLDLFPTLVQLTSLPALKNCNYPVIFLPI